MAGIVMDMKYLKMASTLKLEFLSFSGDPLGLFFMFLQFCLCASVLMFFIPVLLVCSHLNLLDHIAADAPPTTTPTKKKIMEDWQIIGASVLGGIVVLVLIGAMVHCCCRKKRTERRRDGNIPLFRYDSSYSVIPSKLLNNLLIS